MERVESLDVANIHRKWEILLPVCLGVETSPFSCPATGTSQFESLLTSKVKLQDYRLHSQAFILKLEPHIRSWLSGFSSSIAVSFPIYRPLYSSKSIPYKYMSVFADRCMWMYTHILTVLFFPCRNLINQDLLLKILSVVQALWQLDLQMH